ncbi:MAG: putative rane protein [Herbinix sp.]|jgi:hypothetical protein|nr:putative rane protein [Herbinix sp.]
MKKNDIKLLLIITVVGLLCLLVLYFTRTDGDQLVITRDGEVIETFPLNKDITYTIEDESGQTNTFEINDGIVDMTDASCPDKICVNHRSIHYNGETIVCLPNKVILEIQSDEENEIDAITN